MAPAVIENPFHPAYTIINMKNAQEVWTAMILCAYAKKREISIAEAAERLLSDGGLSYLEDCYGALHTQSNEDVVDELIDMAKERAVK